MVAFCQLCFKETMLMLLMLMVCVGETRLNGDDLLKSRPRQDPDCEVGGLECSRMDNHHWKVPPYWTRKYNDYMQ